MTPGLPEEPPIAVHSGAVDAAHYNRVRLAFARLGCPQDLMLGLRGLRVRLGKKVWLCSDKRLNDMPLIAWTGFNDVQRASIHEPVGCRLFYYHPYGRIVAPAVLGEVARRLEGRLQASQPPTPAPRGRRVVPFPRLN